LNGVNWYNPAAQRIAAPTCGLDAAIAGDRAQREEELGSLAVTVPEIPAPDLRGMGRPDRQPIILGGCLLPAAARER